MLISEVMQMIRSTVGTNLTQQCGQAGLDTGSAAIVAELIHKDIQAMVIDVMNDKIIRLTEALENTKAEFEAYKKENPAHGTHEDQDSTPESGGTE